MIDELLDSGIETALEIARGNAVAAGRGNGYGAPWGAADDGRRLRSFRSLAASLAGRTRDYLAAETGIAVGEVGAASENVDQLRLRDITAVIGVGGNVGMLVAFSFPMALADVLYRRLTAGIEVPPGQEADFREATITEIANIIVGHCTADFTEDGAAVAISPPVLIQDAKSINRMNKARFGTVQISTPQGDFDIHLIGPRGMFDDEMNYRGVP